MVKGLICYLHLFAYFVDPVHDMYQYSLKISPRGLKNLGFYSVNEVVRINIY
jgi:hypothetical protein